MMTASIYGLVDPRTERIRYVGRTRAPLATRLSAHYSGGSDATREWVVELRSMGLRPKIVALEECDIGQSEEREAHWIAIQRESSDNLNRATRTKLTRTELAPLREIAPGVQVQLARLPGKKKKNVMVASRFTPEDWTDVMMAADLVEESPRVYLRNMVIKAARVEIRKAGKTPATG